MLGNSGILFQAAIKVFLLSFAESIRKRGVLFLHPLNFVPSEYTCESSAVSLTLYVQKGRRNPQRAKLRHTLLNSRQRR